MADRFLVWVSTGILAAGVSAATLSGAGVAIAEDGEAAGAGTDTTSESVDSDGAETDSEGQQPDVGSDDADESDVDQPDADDPDDTDEEPAASGEGAETDEDDADTEPVRGTRRSARDDEDVEHVKPVDTNAETAETDPDETSAPEIDEGAPTDDDAVTVTTAVTETFEAPAPASEPNEPNVVETVVSAVSSVVGTLLSPFASNTPQTPAAQPQMWTLMAAARREFETAFEAPSLEMQANAVENSLTYTPPPSFQDNITLAFLEAMGFFRQVTGIDLTINLGRVMATGTPPFFVGFGLDSRRTVWEADDGTAWRVWEFDAPGESEDTVIAFHGGGWIVEPSVLNWLDYTNMARQTGATVIVPLYPLATTEAGRATEVIPDAADFISDQIAARGSDNVSLYGDSAGSLIAIAAVRELLLAGEPVPSSMVLISLVADSSLSNPDILDVDDPLFDADQTQGVWESHWFDGITDRRDPLVSPLFFEAEVLGALPPTTIYVGEREIVYPDTLLLHQRAVDEGAPISVVVGTGLVHNWAQDAGVPLLGYTQTTAVRPDIYRELGLTEDTTVSLAKVQEPEAITMRAEAESVAKPTLIHTIGSFAWGMFDAVAKLFAGPPSVPPGSTVTAVRSALEIDCGDGYTTEADWYFPAEGETPPTKLIYLQHGAFATAGMYNVTAAELAERNNAIVVAPTITSNFFACDACALGGDPMHGAVAELFLDDRAALLVSAQAAGFEGDALPQRFVIAGHSGGGQLAGGAAGYYAEFADDELQNLAGVLLLDTSAVGGAVERGVAKIPDDIPVYVISAAPAVMNGYGGVDKVVADLRPGEFVGVQLVGGVHGDAWQSTNALATFIVGVGTGFPAPENVEAAQVLMQGWINDWFTPEDPDTGFYGDPGSVIDIPTDAGPAQAYVLPAPTRELSIVELFIKAIFESTALLTALQTCAEDPSAAEASSTCSAESADEAV